MNPTPKPAKRKASSRKPPSDGREILKDTGKGSEYEARTYEMARRQDYACALCGKAFTFYSPPTFDHQVGRGHGGGHRDDRIEVDGWLQNAAAHGSCNNLKGSKRYEWQYPEGKPVYVEVKIGR